MELKKDRKRHTIYRLPPCPAYDVEGMESWLTDMARRGWFLAKDGIFAGVATFESGTPCNAQYRLEAAQKSTSIWAEDGGEPDPEQVELSEKYTWEYVTKRGSFYIYRSFYADARELNTDPQVQALTLNAVKKRQFGAVMEIFFWAFVYPLCMLHGGILITAIHMKTWFFLLAVLFALWMLADALIGLVCFNRYQKRLQEGRTLASGCRWRKRRVVYFSKKGVKIVLAVVLLGLLLQNWSRSVLAEDKVQLDQYGGEIPFATMADFAGAEATDYRMTMLGMEMGFNTVQEWSDWLAPRCLDYGEHAEITLSDGRTLNGGLYVAYYETASPVIARLLAREYYRLDKRKDNFQEIQAPAVDAEFVAAYKNELHFPTILIQKGNLVLRAYFYQTSETYTMDFTQWAKIMAQSLQEK